MKFWSLDLHHPHLLEIILPVSQHNKCKNSKKLPFFLHSWAVGQIDSVMKAHAASALFFRRCSDGSSCIYGTFCLLLCFKKFAQVASAQHSANTNDRNRSFMNATGAMIRSGLWINSHHVRQRIHFTSLGLGVPPLLKHSPFTPETSKHL